MVWIDAYSEKYQRANGFPVTILSKPNNFKAFLSLKPTTRAAYDLSMREDSIDGIITLNNVQRNLKAGQEFYINTAPNDIYIIQTCSYWEQQPNTRNINAVRSNCIVSIQRYGFKDETSTKEEWYDLYTDIDGYISETLKESKNFDAGFEVDTWKNVQIPQFNIDDEFYDVKERDRIVVYSRLDKNRKLEIYAESVDMFGVNGVIRIMGTLDIRNKR